MTEIPEAALDAAAQAIVHELDPEGRDKPSAYDEAVARAALTAALPYLRQFVIEEALGRRATGEFDQAFGVAIRRLRRIYGGSDLHTRYR